MLKPQVPTKGHIFSCHSPCTQRVAPETHRSGTTSCLGPLIDTNSICSQSLLCGLPRWVPKPWQQEKASTGSLSPKRGVIKNVSCLFENLWTLFLTHTSVVNRQNMKATVTQHLGNKELLSLETEGVNRKGSSTGPCPYSWCLIGGGNLYFWNLVYVFKPEELRLSGKDGKQPAEQGQTVRVTPTSWVTLAELLNI